MLNLPVSFTNVQPVNGHFQFCEQKLVERRKTSEKLSSTHFILVLTSHDTKNPRH